jgi:Rrf2 family protein
MLSKKSKYAIKALVCLAKRYDTKTLLKTSEIAEEENIPRKFLEAILVEMRNNGLVLSKMGAHGGYYLSKHPEEVLLSHVIRISGGPIAMLPCVSLNFYERCEECPTEEICSLRSVMLEVREATLKILSKTSLSDLIAREDSLKALLKKS